MKRVQLKDVMQHLRLVVTDSGYELHNEAGSAKYDQWGHRREVNGIPEYFPFKLTLNGKGKVSLTASRNSENDVPGKLRDIIQRIGSSNALKDLEPIQQPNEGVINNHYHITVAADANGKQYAAGMGVGVEDGKKTGQNLADCFEVHDGQVFIKDAFLKTDGLTSAAKNVIENARVNQAHIAQQDSAIASLSNAIACMGETIKESMREAAERGATEGAKRARQDILKDFQTRGPLRRTL